MKNSEKILVDMYESLCDVNKVELRETLYHDFMDEYMVLEEKIHIVDLLHQVAEKYGIEDNVQGAVDVSLVAEEVIALFLEKNFDYDMNQKRYEVHVDLGNLYSFMQEELLAENHYNKALSLLNSEDEDWMIELDVDDMIARYRYLLSLHLDGTKEKCHEGYLSLIMEFVEYYTEGEVLEKFIVTSYECCEEYFDVADFEVMYDLLKVCEKVAQEACEESEELGDRIALGTIYYFMGSFLKAFEKYKEAVDYFARSADVFTAVCEQDSDYKYYNKLGLAIGEMGQVAIYLGQIQHAISCLEKSLELLKQAIHINERNEIADSVQYIECLLVECYKEMGKGVDNTSDVC